jgi:hypothetical protein
MDFPCNKCSNIDYNLCIKCELIVEYQIWIEKQEEKEYKNKKMLKGKGKNGG